MHHFSITTPVAQDYQTVAAGFNEALFKALQPWGVKVNVLRFDGCNKGDIVELKLYIMGIIPQYWKSTITDAQQTEGEIFFVDESSGRDLPSFLRQWKHTHRIVRDPQNPDTSLIIDDIQFEAKLGLSWFWAGILKRQFKQRSPVYQRIFGRR